MKKLIVAASCMALAACGSVDAGNVGLFNSYGSIDKEVVGPGMHTYNILTTSLEEMSVASTPMKGDTQVYTKDLQTAGVSYTLTTALDPKFAVKMRKAYGIEWRDKLIPPIAESTIKDVFGQFNAGEAISKRTQLQSTMKEALRKRFADKGVIVEGIELTNIDYSDAFEAAVEQAQVATQKAIAAKNATVRIEEEAKQTGIKAEAEANSIRVQAQAISANPAIVQMRWVETWDGRMPDTVYCSSSTPCVGGGK